MASSMRALPSSSAVDFFKQIRAQPKRLRAQRLATRCSATQEANRNTVPGCVTGPLSRRDVLGLASSIAATISLPSTSFAAKGPKGFNVVQDRADGYEFVYPFGWQEVPVKGVDVVYKDIIEPLESVSVQFIDTDKQDVTEFGEAQEVALTLAEKVLSSPNQTVKLVNSSTRDTNGHMYYEFEFTAANPRYTRHSLAVVTVANGKFYTLTTGANEKRWAKVQDQLKTVVKSFAVINPASADAYMS